LATPRNNSVLKAFTLLMAFRHSEEWVTCSELSRRAQLPEPSGNRLLQTLEEIGAVVRGARGLYRPGLLLLSLSRNVAVNDCLRAPARDIMSDLSRRLTATVHLARLEGAMITFIEKFALPDSCQIQTFPGAKFEPYSSALGKILLAGLPPAALDKFILDGELVPLTPNTITNEVDFRTELDRVRRDGAGARQYGPHRRRHVDHRECREDDPPAPGAAARRPGGSGRPPQRQGVSGLRAAGPVHRLNTGLSVVEIRQASGFA
jgi:DNA-binding IclR family transcriptional regulator